MMVVNDANVDDYINFDMTELVPAKAVKDENINGDIRLALQDKLMFREKMADKISITRLDYFFRVMRKSFARSSVSDPDAYKDKIRAMVKEERRALLRVNSATSGFSMFSKSMKSSQKSGSESGKGSSQGEDFGDHEDNDDAELGLDKDKKDPVIESLTAIFQAMNSEIKEKGKERIANLNRIYGNSSTKLKK